MIDQVIIPPAGSPVLPEYERGWLREDGSTAPFLSYVDDDASVNWSADLEVFHQDSGREHFLEAWTREAIVASIGPLPARATIVDVGASTGYLLEDLRSAFPQADLVGIDLVPSGLKKAHAAVPGARLLRADACELPLRSGSVDALVSANVLEHIADDRRALADFARVLKPGARAALVVPAAPGTYDYYDRFLDHERRYARHELALKGREVGLHVSEDSYLAGLIYPAFWLVKRYNRVRFRNLVGPQLAERVAHDISRTGESRLAPHLRRVEERLRAAGVRVPFGIRSLVVLRKPEAQED
jgi:ubiquinone/menaquinone biosynthesis C-methylase UbiE